LASRPESISSAASEAPIVLAVPDTDENWNGEEYFVDPVTHKTMVTKHTVHDGRRASVTLEVGDDGKVKQIVGGSAQLPGETDRHYFRQMSSFAIWQLSDKPAAQWFAWAGEQKRPYFCYLIIVITGGVLIGEIGRNGWAIEPFNVNPVFGPKTIVLLEMGAKRTDLIVKGEVQRLIAPIFLHGGILHYVFNMVGLVNIGFSLEREFGSPKIALIYLVSGFMGVLCSAVFLPTQVGVGASGAIFGLFGAAWGDLIQNWGQYKTRGNARCTLFQLTFGTVLNLMIGLLPVLDQFAHLGGMLTGVSLGLTLLLQRRYTRFAEDKGFKKRQRFLQVCGLLSVPAAMITFLVLIFVLFRGQDPNKTFCTWCKYLDCVPIQGAWTCNACDGMVGTAYPANGTIVVTCPNDAPSVTGVIPNGTVPDAALIDSVCNTYC
jgi:membrane associated rhomboid family serine protease